VEGGDGTLTRMEPDAPLCGAGWTHVRSSVPSLLSVLCESHCPAYLQLHKPYAHLELLKSAETKCEHGSNAVMTMM